MNESVELYSKLQPAHLSEFGAWFTGFKHTAFRLECLPVYLVDDELEYFKLYKEGATCPESFNKDWIDIQQAAKMQNKQMSRVRVIPELDTENSYYRFECEWGYRRSIEVGEKIYTIKKNNLLEYTKNVPVLGDYWLFDKEQCYLINYDFCGRFLGVMKLPDDSVKRYAELATELIAKSENMVFG